MITDLLEKTPDTLLGGLAAVSIWFGFNYVVLADRAMDKVIQNDLLPACISQLQRDERSAPINNVPQINLPKVDIPFFEWMNGMAEMIKQGKHLSSAQRYARCVCATERTSAALKFDYAVHTSSFRLIKVESANAMRGKSLNFIQSQACGAIPWLNVGG